MATCTHKFKLWIGWTGIYIAIYTCLIGHSKQFKVQAIDTHLHPKYQKVNIMHPLPKTPLGLDGCKLAVFSTRVFGNSQVAFVACFAPLSSTRLVWHHLAKSEQRVQNCTLQHLFLSPVTSSVNTNGLVPPAAVNAHAVTLLPPCLTDDAAFRS